MLESVCPLLNCYSLHAWPAAVAAVLVERHFALPSHVSSVGSVQESTEFSPNIILSGRDPNIVLLSRVFSRPILNVLVSVRHI
jgi:hypothetical protein